MSSGLKGYSKPWGDGTPKWVRDDAANDSDKSFTISGRSDIRYIHAELATTATVGARVLVCMITTPAGTIYAYKTTSSIAASGTGVLKLYFGSGDYNNTAAVSPLLSGSTPTFGISYSLPLTVIPSGSTIRVYDASAIDAAADDLTVVLHYVEYDA